MLVVVCLDLEDGVDPIKGLVDCTPLDGAEVTLLHVIDDAERTKLEDSVRPGIVRPSLPDVEETLEADERSMLRETYEEAVTILHARHEGDVRLNVGSGRPERVIVSYLIEVNEGLCVLGRRPDWKRNREVGPRSVGKVARFVIDHAPCPVLVLRLESRAPYD
jgi:nucleotide-binding universal stress UspA family protein